MEFRTSIQKTEHGLVRDFRSAAINLKPSFAEPRPFPCAMPGSARNRPRIRHFSEHCEEFGRDR